MLLCQLMFPDNLTNLRSI
uniref:Uncharacterized protein n=1 Tax=Anguilla anguilla TaxID=7936 RepID=A0A0E9PVV7_ANGAN